MPPRHGKSETISHYFPAWFLELNPDKRIILASYEASFAASWGRKVRNLLNENQDRLTVRLAKDSQAADWFETTKHGGMITAGVGGAITGRGADVLIVDDPIKNSEEAFSQTMRDKTWEWWQSTAYTRLEPNGAAIVLLTRWNEDDLGGRLLATGDWEHLNLPALAEEDDQLGRDPGQPLWPERFDLDTLADIQRSVGSYSWNALYQQRPSSVEGAIIHRAWWRRYDTLPDGLNNHLISVDCSFKGQSTSDYNVFQCWACKGADDYLIDQVRFKGDFPELLSRFKAFCLKHPLATRRLIEEKANGAALISTLRREVSGLIAINPKDSKVSRVHAVSAKIESGNVFIPNQPWVDEFLTEFTAFPAGHNDDSVDAASQALNWLTKNRFTPTITRPDQC